MSLAEQGLDDGGYLVTATWTTGAEAMGQSITVDRPDQFALDV